MTSRDATPDKTSRPHDALFKAAFERTEHAAAYFRGCFPQSLKSAVAWETLKLVPGSFIDPKLADSHSDLLFLAQLDGKEAFIYVLFEHQSTSDGDIVLRMLEYEVRIWRRHRKEHGGRTLPVIIPMLISHAEGGWTEPVTLWELLDPNPAEIPGLEPLVPNFRILLEDLVLLSNEELKERALEAFPKLALLLLRDARDADSMNRNVAEFKAVWQEALTAPGGVEAVAILLRYVWCVCERLNFDDFRENIRNQLPEAEYAAMTIAEELLEQGRAQGMEKGMEKGARLGRADSLKKLIALKFGEIEPDQLDQIEAASLEQLDRYIERILSAQSVDELLDEVE